MGSPTTVARWRAALPLAALCLATGAQAQALHAPIEGTWRLVAWRVGRDTTRAPVAAGVISLRDGVVVWQVHTTHGDTLLDRTGIGRYTIQRTGFSYWYAQGLEVDRVGGAPPLVHDTLPFTRTRAFQLLDPNAGRRTRYVYVADDGRQVYTVSGDTLTVVQNGLLSRAYVRERPSPRRR